MQRLYRAKLLLLGFDSEMDICRMDDEIVIRRGEKDELQETYDRINVSNVFGEKYYCEYTFWEDSVNRAKSRCYELIDKMNFFFGIVDLPKIKTKSCEFFVGVGDINTFKSCGHLSINTMTYYFDRTQMLTVDETQGLVAQWETFSQYFESHNRSFKTAYRRIILAIGIRSPEDKMIDLAIALEATLLKSRESSGLSVKLAKRGSYLLRELYDSNKVHKFLKLSYKVRSLIVHGEDLSSTPIIFKERELDTKAMAKQLKILLFSMYHEIIFRFTELSEIQLIDYLDTNMNAIAVSD